MTDPISATPISAAMQQPAAANPAVKDQMGKDTFLKLLVAQLRYQDPMKPADGSEFLAQTAQFTSVEKLTQLTTQNEAMLASQNLLGAASMVGRTVTYLNADGQRITGVVSSVRLDPAGTTVHVGDADVAIARVTDIRDTAPRTTTGSTPAPAGGTTGTAGTTAT